MEQPFSLPEAFESARIADQIVGYGYENTPAALRAWIKTTLALAQTIWPECSALSEHSEVWTERGFGRTIRTRPAPWVLAVLGPHFAAAPRLASALMCARLAGAHNILAVWSATAEELPPQLAATLDLAGVEHALALPPGECRTLADELNCVYGRGRVLLFPGGDPLFASRETTPGALCWRDVSRPVLGILPEADPDPDVLRRAHPDAEIRSVSSKEEAGRCDVLYAGTGSPASPPASPLLLRAGLEGCWLSRDLEPRFFRNISNDIFPASPPEAESESLA